MRLQIVKLDNDSPSSFENFLQFGKFGVAYRCRGKYSTVHEIQIERTNSIAATIFIQKDTFILCHWHVLANGTKIEDETLLPRNEELDKMGPKDLFENLILNSQGRVRRFCPA